MRFTCHGRCANWNSISRLRYFIFVAFKKLMYLSLFHGEHEKQKCLRHRTVLMSWTLCKKNSMKLIVYAVFVWPFMFAMHLNERKEEKKKSKFSFKCGLVRLDLNAMNRPGLIAYLINPMSMFTMKITYFFLHRFEFTVSNHSAEMNSFRKLFLSNGLTVNKDEKTLG